MAHICEVCGKGIMSGNNVSHSNRHTKAAWKPNVQTECLHPLPAFRQSYPRIIRNDTMSCSLRRAAFLFCALFIF